MTMSGDEQFEQIESDVAPPSQQVEQGDESQQLRSAIERLPAEYREALMLREFEGLSYKEIAAVAHVRLRPMSHQSACLR